MHLRAEGALTAPRRARLSLRPVVQWPVLGGTRASRSAGVVTSRYAQQQLGNKNEVKTQVIGLGKEDEVREEIISN